MKPKDIRISLIIPAHNASSVIENSIREYSKFLSQFKDYEIIVVCNACRDNTAEICNKEAKINKEIKVIEIGERGKGFAILQGFNQARYEIIGFLDADNAFYLDSIKQMILQLKAYDCVIASKWIERDFFEISEPLTRKVLAAGWRLLSKFLLGLDFKDTQAGAKFLRKEAYEKISHNFICTGFDFDIELLYRLQKSGCSVKEIRIPVSKSFKFSTFRLKFVPGMFWHMLKLWNEE